MADTEHTPGKIQHRVLMGKITINGRDEDIFHCGLGLRNSRYADEQAANARRLAACWNACEGLTTEWLENMATEPATCGVEHQLQLSKDKMQAEAQRDHFEALAKDNGQTIIKTACELSAMQAQRDELLAALTQLEQANDKRSSLMSGEAYLIAVRQPGMSDALIELDDARREARAAIAKATGAAA